MKLPSLSQNAAILLALFLGIMTPFLGQHILMDVAEILSSITIKTLNFISMPLIFLSVVATLTGMESLKRFRLLGKIVFRYTLITTVIAASIACLIYLSIGIEPPPIAQADKIASPNLVKTILLLYPSNIVSIFMENNVFGIMLFALAFGSAILTMPVEKKETMHAFFSALFSAFLKIASYIIRFIPISIWAFVTLFVQTILLKGTASYRPIALFLIVVVFANLIQGFIVLPVMLIMKGLSPIKLFKAVSGALNVAFFSKSSAATLPITLTAMEEKVKIPSSISSFVLPLCGTINMNGCAAFIFTAVVFVSSLNGVIFSAWQLIAWIMIATVAAIGNAGVPMGCFFLASALLSGIGVPLEAMGLILPFYAFLDMIETALNVWSDCCVTAIVAKQMPETNVQSAFLK